MPGAGNREKQKVDWEMIGRDYINSQISLRELAEKYSLGLSTLKRHCSEGKWQQARELSKQQGRMHKLEQVTDKLLDKMAQTIDQEEHMDAKEYKAYTSALKEIKEVQDMGGKEQEGAALKLEIQLSPELEELAK